MGEAGRLIVGKLETFTSHGHFPGAFQNPGEDVLPFCPNRTEERLRSRHNVSKLPKLIS